MSGLLFKWTNRDGTLCNGGTGRWSLPQNGTPGEWFTTTGKLVPCSNGIHACRPDDLPLWAGPALHVFEWWVERSPARSQYCWRMAELCEAEMEAL